MQAQWRQRDLAVRQQPGNVQNHKRHGEEVPHQSRSKWRDISCQIFLASSAHRLHTRSE